MNTAILSQENTAGMPSALRRAQAAIHLPEVQAMLHRLSDFNLGIFMPHLHDEQSGDFLPLPDELMQVESDCKVTFLPAAEVQSQRGQFLPVAWLWRAGGPGAASACEMITAAQAGDPAQSVKHKMPTEP